MNNKKNRTHLTPEEVQEFINLGVEFGETDHCHVKVGAGNSERILRENLYDEWDITFACFADAPCYAGLDILPAPNLQEVLEVLPISIRERCLTGEQEVVSFILSIQRRLSLANDCDFIYVAEYAYSPADPYEMCTMMSFADKSPLIALADLLRWVCKNHPETLTKIE